MKNTKGITLVALVVTIIILLILAGISIQALTQTNLFNQAKRAKNATENAQREENKILSEYIDEMNKYLPETLVYKVNSGEVPIGSYIKYTPDTASEETINKLIEELGTYSGSQANTKETLKQEIGLNWRVLDVKDGEVRLISDVPTTSTVALDSYNGYNNAVYLLDDICNELYNNSKLTNKVQNLKIEDIEKNMNETIEKDDTLFVENGIKYPQILEQEEGQFIIENQATPKLKQSEQNTLLLQGEELISSSSSKLKKTFYYYETNENSFVKKEYYNLFINDNGNYYSPYFMSSRIVNARSNYVDFGIRRIEDGNIRASSVYGTGKVKEAVNYFRPVITLNSNVQLDTTKAADGTQPSTAYEIK